MDDEIIHGNEAWEPFDDDNIPEWNPEWDLIDPGDLGQKRTETERFINALRDMVPENPEPDSTIPRDASETLLPIFAAALKNAEENEQRFMSGNIILNFAQYKNYCNAARFLKYLQKRGAIDSMDAKIDPGKRSSSISFTAKDPLHLSGSDKDTFADILDCVISFGFHKSVKHLTEYQFMSFYLEFQDIWIKISDTADSNG